MTDERVFATKHMNKPMNEKGDLVIIEDSPNKVFKGSFIVKAKPSYRKLLYVFHIPLLLIDWIVTLLSNIMEIVTNSIKELTLGLESFINHADSKPSEQET